MIVSSGLTQAYLEERMVRDLRIFLGRLGFPHEGHSDEALINMVRRTFTRVGTAPEYLRESRHNERATPDDAEQNLEG